MLTAIWLLPALGGTAVMLAPRSAAKLLAIAVGVATLALAAYVAYSFDTGAHGYQFVERLPWIPDYKIDYHLGVDGISVWLLVLNAFLGVIALLATPQRTANLSRFLGLLLLMQAGMTGVFLAVDLVLFYVFWEAMLIPAYFLLWLWGEGERPERAALKFVLFTLVGSLLMLVGVIGVYVFGGGRSFDLQDLIHQNLDPHVQFALFFLFAIAFAIKVPIFPFHSWLPDAYMAAPAAMLVTFAGVMGKTGAYAFLRFAVPLFPQPAYWWDWRWVLAALGVASIVYGAFLALAQRDMKAVVAYSSISHMGFIVLGIFALNAAGQQGAVLQMVNHGIIVAALFLIVAWIAARAGTTDRTAVSGLAPRMPVLAAVFLIATLAALGLPGLNSFVGEFMTMLGAWQLAPALAVIACVGLILTPVYMLRLYQGAMYGESAQAARAQPKIDIALAEVLVVLPLLVLMLVLGLFPYLLTRAMQ